MDYFDQIIEAGAENVEALLSPEPKDSLLKKALFKRNVEIVNLEFSYRCNRKCDYCPVKDSSRRFTQVEMPVALVKKIASELQSIRFENRLCLNLYNEPLLDNTLEDKISILRRSLPFAHLSFNSNGDKLNAKRLKSLSDAGLDYICVTLHPKPYTTDSDKTLKTRVSKMLEKLQVTSEISYDRNDGSIDIRSQGVAVRIQWPDWREVGTSRASLLEDHKANQFIREQPCAKPFRELHIYYDGNVQPCCEAFHDDQINLVELGNVASSSIFDVYASSAAARFRQHLFDFGPKKGICQHCTVADYSDREKDDAKRKAILNKLG